VIDVRAMSEMLLQAEKTRVALEPLTTRYPELRPEDAYQVQLAGVRTKLSGGRRVV
jgi:2-keto-4-pentenoate hydratase